MARPLTVNKSNYFIFGGQYVIADDEFIKNIFLPDVRFKNILSLNDERHNNIVKEVSKIIKEKIRGGNDYTDIRIIASYTRNQYMRNMFNHVLTISFRKLNPS